MKTNLDELTQDELMTLSTAVRGYLYDLKRMASIAECENRGSQAYQPTIRRLLSIQDKLGLEK